MQRLRCDVLIGRGEHEPTKFTTFNAKFLVFNTQFLVFATKFRVLDTKFISSTHRQSSGVGGRPPPVPSCTQQQHKSEPQNRPIRLGWVR